MFDMECGVVIDTQRRSLISFKHVSLRCLLFDPHRTIDQSEIEARLRTQTP